MSITVEIVPSTTQVQVLTNPQDLLGINTAVLELNIDTSTITTVEVSATIPTASEASLVSVVPYASITATNLQDALDYLALHSYRTSSTPATAVVGTTWYNTATNQYYVYRNISGTLSWVPIMVGNDSIDSDTVDAGAF